MSGASVQVAEGTRQLDHEEALWLSLWDSIGAPTYPFCAHCGEEIGTEPRYVGGREIYRFCRRCERDEVSYWSGDRSTHVPARRGG